MLDADIGLPLLGPALPLEAHRLLRKWRGLREAGPRHRVDILRVSISCAAFAAKVRVQLAVLRRSRRWNRRALKARRWQRRPRQWIANRRRLLAQPNPR